MILIRQLIIYTENLTTLINGLDVGNDIVRYSVPLNNVTAPKWFQHRVTINELYSQNGATVQDVNVAEWIRKSVLISGDYTIQGLTVIENPIFFENLK